MTEPEDTDDDFPDPAAVRHAREEDARREARRNPPDPGEDPDWDPPRLRANYYRPVDGPGHGDE